MRKDCECFTCGVRSVSVQPTGGYGCLTQACVAENDIKDDGATALASALSHLVELRELDVAGPPPLQAVETYVLAKRIPCTVSSGTYRQTITLAPWAPLQLPTHWWV